MIAPGTRRGLRLPGARRSDAARRPTLARLFATGSAVVLLIAVAAVVLGATALNGLTQSRAVLLDRVAPALDAGQRLSVALLNQETGVRGFTLTARAEFLAPYRAGVSAEDAALTDLRALSENGDLGPVAQDLAAVTASAEAWRDAFAGPSIEATRTGSGAPPGPVVGRELFDVVRAGVDDLLGELRAAQVDARQDVAAAAAFLLAGAAAVAVVLVLVLVAAAIGLRRTVLAPVSDLAGQVRAVVSGDVQREVRADGPREIMELGDDVEAMRARILRDLDDTQEANRRLDEQARDLERSNRDLEQFAYVASHDLQEPLRKVSSFCQLLQRRYGGQLDERADQYIEFAVDGAQRMQRLINDLLAFSRVGRTTSGFTQVSLGEVAAAAAAQLEQTRAETGGRIDLGPLPAVTGDPTLLRQLLLNLIGNSLKFHREGVPPVVEVSGELDGENVELTVSDNGIGIDAEYADKIFVIFQRLHARDVYPGTGIGLALAKKIVEFHGGTITLHPREDSGATVRVTLPVRPAPDRPASEELSA